MKTPFKFRQYQLEDMARAALMDGVVFSWEQGLGKSLAAFIMPLLWSKRHHQHPDTHTARPYLSLLVAPGSLHNQLAREGREKFGVECVIINSIDDAMADPYLRHRILNPHPEPGSEIAEPINRFYLTTYTALGMNGADERAAELRNVKGQPTVYLSQNATRLRLETDPTADPVGKEWAGVATSRSYEDGHTITCLHRPSLSTVVQVAFDAVVCDEATRIKGDDTFISEGVRRLNPRNRLILTGTPIKNRLTDIFWLAHWAAGGHDEPTARWPYGNSMEDKNHFAKEHLVSERNLTKEADADANGRRRTYTKQTNEICGLHRLWKLLAPTVLRRRKADIGEDLVAKRVIPMRVPMGKAQSFTYHWHLNNAPELTKEGEPMARLARVATQLGNLRLAALSPEADSLADSAGYNFTAARIYSNADAPSPWHPKNAATLQILRECLERGEQVTVFSPYHTWSQWLHQNLNRAGVSCERLDGTMSPKLRGDRAAAFKRKEYAVLIAGLKSMGEGHSFDQCPNLILPSLEWAYDVNAQAIERVHRLTSKQDVRIYTMVTKGTIDERLASLFNEKSDASDLALDGQLFKADTEEVNLFQLLQDAIANFDPDADTTPEDDVRAEWESNLRPGLRAAHAIWKGETPTLELELTQPEKPKAKPTPPKPEPKTTVTIDFPTHPGIRSPGYIQVAEPTPLPATPVPDPETHTMTTTSDPSPALPPANVIAFVLPGNPGQRAPLSHPSSKPTPLDSAKPKAPAPQPQPSTRAGAFTFPAPGGKIINLFPKS